MLKFLVLCTVFFLLYLGFNSISEFDSLINFSVWNYQIETTIFTFGLIFLVVQIALMLILKTIFVIFNIPSIIKESWYKKKLIKINEKLVTIIAELLMDNKIKSLDLTKKLISELNQKTKELSYLVANEMEENFDLKIQHLRKLLDKKDYSFYAAKKLANIFFANKHYREAEDYATKAFNEKGSDTDLMILLIKIYAKLETWPKMFFVISKLQRADIKLFDNYKEEISEYYYLAAKEELSKGNDSEAINLLESALELNPSSLNALTLFTELNVNMNNSVLISKVLKSAFSIKPNFEIAQIYADSSKNSPNVIYATLASLANPEKNKGLFLAIAAYLGLQDKFDDIKNKKVSARQAQKK